MEIDIFNKSVNELNELELLIKYMTLDLKKEIKQLTLKQALKEAINIIENSENLFDFHGLAWELGSKNLEFFCLYFLRDIYIGENKSELSKTHFEIWKELENMILKKDYIQRNYICPRGFGKTTCISTPLAIWCHCYNYKKYTVIASAVADTAEQFLKTIKMSIEDNKRIEKSFGKLIDSKNFICNSEKIEFTNRTMIQSISASGAIRGKNYNTERISLLILDDYQKSDECITKEARDKKWKTFNEDAKNAMQKDNSTMLAVGTIQGKDCFYSRLWDSATWKTHYEKGVLVDNVDKYFHTGLWEQFYKLLINKNDDNRLDSAKEFYFQHEKEMNFPMLWQEYWNCLDYALSYYEDRLAFFQEVQNDVSNIGDKKFKTIIPESDKEINSHDFKKTILVIDPANTRTKTSKKDYFAFAVTSIVENKIKYIRKGEIYKFTKNREYEDYIEHTISLLKKYKDITHLCIEKNTYGGADALKIQELINSDKELKHRNIKIVPYYQNSNKDDKIQTIVGAVNLGQIIFNEDDTEGIEQMKEFTTCKLVLHDDFPDVVAQACKMIDEIKVVKKLNVVDIRKFGL